MTDAFLVKREQKRVQNSLPLPFDSWIQVYSNMVLWLTDDWLGIDGVAKQCWQTHSSTDNWEGSVLVTKTIWNLRPTKIKDQVFKKDQSHLCRARQIASFQLISVPNVSEMRWQRNMYHLFTFFERGWRGGERVACMQLFKLLCKLVRLSI